MKLTNILLESYNQWVMPSLDTLKREFRVEHEKKGLDVFKDEADFIDAVHNAKVESISHQRDQDIDYRTGTGSFKELLDLIKGYASYPKYRNANTLKDLYKRFKSNQAMDYPIVLQYKDNSRRILSGNTRMDVAFQLGITPKVLIVKARK